MSNKKAPSTKRGSRKGETALAWQIYWVQLRQRPLETAPCNYLKVYMYLVFPYRYMCNDHGVF